MAHANVALNFNAFLEKTKLKDDGSINKMIPHSNSKRRVPPNCAPLRRFVVSKHHVMIGCDRSLRSHTTGVRQFYTCKNT